MERTTPAPVGKDYMLSVRLTAKEKRHLDSIRGRDPISGFVRRLIATTRARGESLDS